MSDQEILSSTPYEVNLLLIKAYRKLLLEQQQVALFRWQWMNAHRPEGSQPIELYTVLPLEEYIPKDRHGNPLPIGIDGKVTQTADQMMRHAMNVTAAFGGYIDPKYNAPSKEEARKELAK